MVKGLRYSRQFHIAAGLITVLIIGLVDYVTGPDTSLAIFYLVPIVQVTWFGGLVAGVVTALGSAVAWLAGELLAGPLAPHLAIPIWNVVLAFCFFLAVSLVLSAFRNRLQRESALATVDPLTGATNARHFRETIQTEKDRAIRYKHPLTLAHVDVDDFQQLSRQLGRRTTDTFMRAVAATMRENLRSSDMIARLGKDEFGVLLVEAEPIEAQAIIARAQQRLSEAMEKQGWPATFSFGVITFSQPASSAEEMLRLVTALAGLVKVEGKGSVKFEVYSD